MTFTRRALEALSEAVRGLPRNAGLPETLASDKLLKQLRAVESAPASPAGDLLKQVRHRLEFAAASPGGIGTAASKDVRDSAWLLWVDEDPLATMPGLFELIWGQAERRSTARRNLIEAWIYHYAPNKPMIVEAGYAIRLLLDKIDDPRLSYWRHVSQRYSFFDVPGGPQNIARLVVQDEQPLAKLLEATGLDDPIRAGSGYAGAVQEGLFGLISTASRSPRASEAMNRIVAFVAPRNKLRFDDAERRAMLANSLLRPWRDRGREPDVAIRNVVRGRLLDWLGDPRISTKWAKVDQESIALMLKWHAQVSLKAFFDLIEDHADVDHFTYRRAFWEAYISADLVDEAWLALGSRIYHSAKAIEDLDGAYGRVSGVGIQGNHAALLLRIGNLVFCEWSHSGKVRAWKVSSKNAPQIGLGSYTKDELNGLGLPFPPNTNGQGGASDGKGLSHINSVDGYWQSSVAELLARNTRVRLTKRDWMPK